MQPVFLITDILLFLLVAIAVGYFCYARQHAHLVTPWKHLSKNSVAMGSAAILLAYLSIAVVDSIHFKLPSENYSKEDPHYQPEALSLLDVWLKPLRDKSEKSYSSPFASQLFTKESIEQKNGSTIWDYPSLRYGGVHLNEGQSKSADILIRSIPGVIKGLLLGALVLILLTLYHRKKSPQPLFYHMQQILKGQCSIQWRPFLFVSTGLFIISGIIIELSQVYHVFGTDKIGDSILYQSLKSIRTGILIGTLTTLVMLPFAIILGIAAGYFRGWIDDLIQYIYTTLNSIPSLLLIAAVMLMLQVHLNNNAEDYNSLLERADLRLLFLCMILSVTSWTGLCRYLRAESLKLREMDYIAAARTMGVSHISILSRHILPNVTHIVLITVILDFSGLVLAEAMLAYVQIGVDPTTESWGNMINSARLEMAREPAVWWSLTAAFTFMLILVLAANLFSDAVRDALDPRGQHYD
ncbi:peptide ABC transporter permease [Candidatus Endobugula sertula]|uniref:Peptide ABC transporter permease n=1 Tax=Candidatus Endobugula sertula TaxID=62101 RepID=A0A1D2QT60_9GAMM|nr:peptide ABC transporter permease [Candidatus Endobugula sertula]